MIENILVILAAGIGVRYNSKVPKQYLELKGKRIISIVIEKMKMAKEVDKIIVVVGSFEDLEFLGEIEGNIDYIIGGKDRAHSFQNALDFVDENYKECKRIIYHEAVRPLVSSDIIDRYFQLLNEYDYIVTCERITDSLGTYNDFIPNRDDFFLIQAPEAYRYEVLKKYYDCESEVYFAGNQLPKSYRCYRYFEIEKNIKLTTPIDMKIIETLI